ncbi:hypothetical protein QL285_052513 [Trifolium repens]|nr:hypothetical protein QL285_052513 [Trifolium repens]
MNHIVYPNPNVLHIMLHICDFDDRNFYGIFSIIISSKMTKTDPNTKKNLQKQEKASRQSPRCKKTRKSPKCEKISIPSQHDGSHRATMGAACSPRNQKE